MIFEYLGITDVAARGIAQEQESRMGRASRLLKKPPDNPLRI
jgi:hypothetical protein